MQAVIVGFDWFTGSFVSLVIGRNVNFAFGVDDTQLTGNRTN